MLVISHSAHAIPFTDISGTAAANNAADQVAVDVVAGSGNSVRFNFSFGAGDAGIITAIGFGGSGTILLTGTTSPSFFPSAGVSFENGNPPSLGGGGFTQLFGVERTSQGGVTNGISSGESLGVQYNLAGSATLAQVLASINTGNFNIGLHIQSLDDGGSQKAVLGGGGTPVRDTSNTLPLLGGALLLLAAARRFRR